MAIIETGRVSLDIILIGAAAGIMVGILSISGLAFSMTLQLSGAVRRQRVPAAAADRDPRLRARHRPADGERLHSDRDAACAGADQARRHADGRAYVRHVQRHALDDHAAGGVCGLCRGQHRAHRRLDHRLDRLPGRLEHVHAAVPVRADAEPADGRPDLPDRVEFRAHPVRAVRRHRRDRRIRADAARNAGAPALRCCRIADCAAAGDVHRRLLRQLHRHRRRHRPARHRSSARGMAHAARPREANARRLPRGSGSTSIS